MPRHPQPRRLCAAVAIVLTLGIVRLPPAHAADAPVRLNTLGFLPDAPKRASVAAECSTFLVLRDSDGADALTGKVAAPIQNIDTGESIVVLDFSDLRTPGTYRLDIGTGQSPPFRIAADLYNPAFYTAARAFYLWRCGTAVSATHGGVTFAHPACHLDDALLDYIGGGKGTRRDAIGGWHDAGDYNKYVVNAGFSVGVMLQAWEHFGDRIRRVSLDIPESKNATPDFLDEVRWEIEWMLKMQADDGRVYHKVSTTKFGGFVMPEAEKADRYLTPWSSAATADLVAVAAMAARDFAPYDKGFADRCLAAARQSHAFLLANPADHRADLTGFSTGPYQINDASRRLWAAAELWETTGEADFLNDFEARAKKLDRKVDVTAGWGNVKNFAMYTYALSNRDGRDAALREAVRSVIVSTADEIVKAASAHGYARPLGTRYYWGCNGDVAQLAQTLHVANVLKPNQAYVNTSLDALGHLFGRNVYGRSFVTGLGHQPPLHPHDRRSGSDQIDDPWPGYLVGGGWPKATDWQDIQESYRTNEIAINWNATLVYALAGFVSSDAAGH